LAIHTTSTVSDFNVVVELVGGEEILTGEPGEVQHVRQHGGVVVVCRKVARLVSGGGPRSGIVTVLESGDGEFDKLRVPDVAADVDDEPRWVLLVSWPIPAGFEFGSSWRAGAGSGRLVGCAVEEQIVARCAP
jgi:hypothetical protein